jgi:exosome complex component RRP46
VLALLSAAIPLTATLTSAVLAVVAGAGRDRVIVTPTAREIELSRSLHVFAFTSHDNLILNESEGEFTLKEWNEALESARRQCCPPPPSEDIDMNEDSRVDADLKHFTRSTVEAQVASDLHWK